MGKTAWVLLFLAVPAWAEEKTQESPHHVSFTATMMTEYMVRGLSLSWHEPAPMGSIDYYHDNGMYGGVWAAGVSSNVYVGGHTELGVYGGYATTLKNGLGLDVGLIGYYYPGAASMTAAPQRYNTAEFYAQVTYGRVAVKYWNTLTDYWGINSKDPWCWDTGCTAVNGDSRGSQYLEANVSFDLPLESKLILHAARQWVRHYSELDYNDYRISLEKRWGRMSAALAYSDTSASETRYTYTMGGERENIADNVLQFRLGVTF